MVGMFRGRRKDHEARQRWRGRKEADELNGGRGKRGVIGMVMGRQMAENPTFVTSTQLVMLLFR